MAKINWDRYVTEQMQDDELRRLFEAERAVSVSEVLGGQSGDAERTVI